MQESGFLTFFARGALRDLPGSCTGAGGGGGGGSTPATVVVAVAVAVAVAVDEGRAEVG